ncbi:Tc5 transposase DNA-binding domain-containing protein [Rhizoctonia solani]|uniref:Tc5 transposase DNA-binding domain-containing protein n=1 Tax=Rhizoctonia solani TaxID=456999 RepID=A0A8H8P5C1_9AGAM|nr:Tc5 transposase DNA-binding domain-containing protein [Rhizoctonia solani]QRW23882.1 Tc5 transposase DNA-binding domain-containing protein [Rhizoctonia solani]
MSPLPKLKKSRAPRRPRPISVAVPAQKSTRRSNLTFSDKLRIIDFYREHQGLPGVTQASVVQHFRAEYPTLSQSTLPSYLSKEEQIRDYIRKNPNRLAYKKPTRVALPQIELALTEWVQNRVRLGLGFTGDLLCEQGRKLCEELGVPDDEKIAFSHGWLDRFKERLRLRESWPNREVASAPVEQVAPERARLQQLLPKCSLSEGSDLDENDLRYDHPERQTSV